MTNININTFMKGVDIESAVIPKQEDIIKDGDYGFTNCDAGKFPLVFLKDYYTRIVEPFRVAPQHIDLGAINVNANKHRDEYTILGIIPTDLYTRSRDIMAELIKWETVEGDNNGGATFGVNIFDSKDEIKTTEWFKTNKSRIVYVQQNRLVIKEKED